MVKFETDFSFCLCFEIFKIQSLNIQQRQVVERVIRRKAADGCWLLDTDKREIQVQTGVVMQQRENRREIFLVSSN